MGEGSCGCQLRDMGTLIDGEKYMTNLRKIQQIWKRRNSDKLLKKQEVVLIKISPCCELHFSAPLGTATQLSRLGTSWA